MKFFFTLLAAYLFGAIFGLVLVYSPVALGQLTTQVTIDQACTGSSCTPMPSCSTYTSGALTNFALGVPCGGSAPTTVVWNVIGPPTGTAGTDTTTITGAFSGCTGINAIFLAEGTWAINASLSPPIGCTIQASISGTPYAGSNGTQNTTVDCSALAGTTPCFIFSTSNTLTGFAIKGNGSVSGTNTTCVDNEAVNTGGNNLINMVMINCGYGFNEGSASGTVQNDRLLDVTFSGVGTPVWCHTNCTGSYFSNLTIFGPSVGVFCDVGCTKSNFSVLTEQALAGTGLALKMLGANNIVSNLFGDQGSCVQMNGTTNFNLSGVDCRGASASANNYCLDFVTAASSAVSMVGVLCSTGYSGTGSAIFHEAGVTGGCTSCSFDVSWNTTDPLYASVQAETDFDWQRFMHPVGYKAVTLTTSTFAAPDLQNGFNISLTGTASCPCTLPAPLGAHDGESGYIQFTQPATAVANPLVWNAIYVNTTQPLTTNSQTTWWPWTANNGSINLATPFHN